MHNSPYRLLRWSAACVLLMTTYACGQVHTSDASTSDGPVIGDRTEHTQPRTTILYPQLSIRRAINRESLRAFGEHPNDHGILEALEQTVEDVRFDNTSLREVLAHVRQVYEIRIIPDIQAMNDAGIDLDAPAVTFEQSGLTLRSTLHLLLKDMGLTYLIKEGFVVVTTIERAKEELIVRVYPAPQPCDMQGLVELIQSTIAADSWDTTGGPGAIRPLVVEQCFVVSQTSDVHDRIAAFMGTLALDDHQNADLTARRTRLYVIDDPTLLPEVEKKLVELCNSALGSAGDEDARVTTLGHFLVVQSRVRAFHACAAELIRCINGVKSEHISPVNPQ